MFLNWLPNRWCPKAPPGRQPYRAAWGGVCSRKSQSQSGTDGRLQLEMLKDVYGFFTSLGHPAFGPRAGR